MTLTVPLRRALVLGALVIMSTLVWTASAHAAWYLSYHVQGETFDAAAGSAAAPVADTAAVGRSTLAVTSGAGTRRFLAPPSRYLYYRLRGQACSGSPIVSLELDGREFVRRSVDSATYVDYGVYVDITNTMHSLTVRILNPLTTDSCARKVFFDRIATYSQTPYNTMTSGSVCAGTDRGLKYLATPPGVSTTVLGAGPSGSYYEVGEPSGQYAGRTPKGIMMIIHGGGWFAVGRPHVASGGAMGWRNLGWRTVNMTYSGCGKSFADVLAFYDRISAVYGTTLKRCAYGASAGAHLALLLATKRPLHCVIPAAGPTDFNSLLSQKAYGPNGPQAAGPTAVYHMAVAAFGAMDPTQTVAQNLATYSPITYASSIRARVLQAAGSTDPLLPLTQIYDMQNALKMDPTRGSIYNVATTLAGTPTSNGYFVHGPVDYTEIKRWASLAVEASAG